MKCILENENKNVTFYFKQRKQLENGKKGIHYNQFYKSKNGQKIKKKA